MPQKEIDDRFSKFGVISFSSVAKINDFIDFLEEGKLMGTKCKKCGRHFFPPRADCFESLSSDMEWFEVEGNGKLVTYSILEYAPSGFTEDLPYAIAVVDYGDYKVFGRTDSSIPFSELIVGMEMKTVVKKMSNGQLGYSFLKP